MITKLRKHGSEWLVPVSDDLLNQLGMSEETELEVAIIGKGLVVSVSADAEHRRQVDDALLATNRQFGAALQRLAE
ncbi:MAG: hypothetical protein SFV23_26855 [Planctomycetaceae bacterium]|nr:hypothetical protein [Planctomycetaceae bacterium]